MRWIYKTVHFELKKEGLLGSSFIDETEIEQELNEYGRSGWELISLMEVKDGLIGVLKQPLDELSDFDEEDSFDRKVSLHSHRSAAEPDREELSESYEDDFQQPDSSVLIEDEFASGSDEDEEEKTLHKKERKIGEIRIE